MKRYVVTVTEYDEVPEKQQDWLKQFDIPDSVTGLEHEKARKGQYAYVTREGVKKIERVILMLNSDAVPNLHAIAVTVLG